MDNNELLILPTSNEEFVIAYPVQQGETVTSIAKYFDSSLSEIKSANQLDLSVISPGSVLKIPFSRHMLSTDQSLNTKVIYRPRPKETLYTIGKKYFGLEVEDLIGFNNLEGNIIAVGQDLIIGFVDIPERAEVNSIQSSSESLDLNEDDEPTAHKTIKEVYSISELLDLISNEGDTPEENNGNEYVEFDDDWEFESGIAYKQEVQYESKGLFAFHKNAKQDSWIELSNPMTNAKVNVRVLGIIPNNQYSEDISVVISPSVAESLGAKDKRFRVNMKYIPTNVDAGKE